MVNMPAGGNREGRGEEYRPEIVFTDLQKYQSHLLLFSGREKRNDLAGSSPRDLLPGKYLPVSRAGI